jgi:outer membrane protein assembly factor BamD
MSSCSVKEAKTDFDLLNEGQKNFANRRFERAEENFKKLLDEHPDSKLRIYAMMGLADSLFRSDKFQEAAFQYKEFYELYPVHNDTLKARFYKGMSEFSEMKPADRDQTFTKNALEEFKKITSNPDYTNSLFYEVSKEKMGECNKTLAEHIFFIGEFYFRTASYQSVISRMNSLLAEYPGEPYEDEAIYYLAESYYREDSFKKALAEFERLKEKYPNSRYYNTATVRIADIETREKMAKNENRQER